MAVTNVVAAFWRHAEGYYRKPDGTPTSELGTFRQALRPLRQLYGHTSALAFGPVALKALRQKMIETGWRRKTINKQISRIRSVFKWAASEELVPGSLYHALQTVAGLRVGEVTHGRVSRCGQRRSRASWRLSRTLVTSHVEGGPDTVNYLDAANQQVQPQLQRLGPPGDRRAGILHTAYCSREILEGDGYDALAWA